MNVYKHDSLGKIAFNFSPNLGFRRQLEMFEAMDNTVNPSHEQYKLYRLNIFADMMKSGKYLHMFLWV